MNKTVANMTGVNKTSMNKSQVNKNGANKFGMEESDSAGRAEELARRLGKMIQCATVSHKESYDDTEFAKLRGVVEDLFPLVHSKAERMIFSEDCWLYLLKGKDQSRCVVLMSHHDVAAVGEGWKYPPFSGEIVQGRIWGRGTVDTKSSLFAEFQALEELLKDGFQLPVNVWLASSHNEEIAGDGIPAVVKYFEEQKLAPEFVLDEGGAVIEPPMAGVTKKCSVVAVHEKGKYALKLSAQKEASHGGLNASQETPVARMAKAVAIIQEKQPYIRRFSPELTAMFTSLAPHMQFPMKFVFSHLNWFSGILKFMIPKLNAQAGAMLGTVGVFEDIKVEKNRDGGELCTARLMLRCMDPEDVKKEKRRIELLAKQYGVSVEAEEDGSELHRPASLDCPQYRYIMKCVGKVFPETVRMPFILPAGTDARHFCEMCSCVYRFAPLDIDGQQFGSIHGNDENICVEALPRAVDFYKTVVRNLKYLKK